MSMSAPYRFIPVSSWICEPAWGNRVTHDLPFADGLSGWLDFQITAQSPILIGGERKQKDENSPTHVYFYRLPDGRFAIPGSGLRGSMRSVLEIAAFGRANFIDDVKYGIRDLTRGANAIYQSRLVEACGSGVVSGYPKPLRKTRPKSRAGWLRKSVDPNTGEERWLLRPCKFARVAVAELNKLQGGIETKLRPRENAEARYGHWVLSLKCKLAVGERRFVARAYRLDRTTGAYLPNVGIEYAEATVDSSNERSLDGVIVFTGKPDSGEHSLGDNPRRYYGKKKHEFFFYGSAQSEIDVSHLRQDFLFVHEERTGYPAADSWDHWRDSFRSGKEIPVFYLTPVAGAEKIPTNPNEITAIGLAMMFRLAHENTTHDLLKNAHAGHVDNKRIDMATLLFGFSPDEGKRNDIGLADEAEGLAALKGRVVFEPAVADAAASEVGPINVLLASPKAQFYPAYVKQPIRDGSLVGSTYASYTPVRGGGEFVEYPELAGRKRYPAWPWSPPGNMADVDNSKMQSILHPLAANTKFEGRVRFHNLRPIELGALLWTLRLWAPNAWGKRPNLVHHLGMGKPLGFGQVDISITGAQIECNELKEGNRLFVVRGNRAEDVAAAEKYADYFVTYMEEEFKKSKEKASQVTWKSCEQIETLLAIADPNWSDSQSLKYMELEEFRRRKQTSDVLPQYRRRAATLDGNGADTISDINSFPRPKRSAATMARGEVKVSEPTKKATISSGQNAQFVNGARVMDIHENVKGIYRGPGKKLGHGLIDYGDGEGPFEVPFDRLRQI